MRSPFDPPDRSSFTPLRHQVIVDWWAELGADGDCGRTSWEVLDPIRDAVTDCLADDPPDLDEAEHLTARALLAIVGDDDEKV
jgi:hypothetical protein